MASFKLVIILVLALAVRVAIGRQHVYVVNDLGEGFTLTVHCASKDDDLGTHFLPYGTNFTWKFRINLFHTTLFWCDFQWGNVTDSYIVFAAEDRYQTFVANTYWLSRQDGLYYANDDRQKEYELKHVWGSIF
ncbi:hypothetical protein HHK36_020362 [Tetracentron sinense]|uniref:S-protein homolog n=1 Tax=Tetracentron sinense TaxID=13715 RepID=A0A835D8R9_TETSI|nr:hypothetical protein HHK36_020362 [Tetracentron sinense]